MAPRKGQKQPGGEQNISLGPQVIKYVVALEICEKEI